MVTNMLMWLEASAARVPDRPAFIDATEAVSFADLSARAQAIGSAIADLVPTKRPVVVLMDHRRTHYFTACLGILYAGDFFVPLDSAMPAQRLRLIFEALAPALIIADEKSRHVLDFECPCPVVLEETLRGHAVDPARLAAIRADASYYDVLAVLYTSGSTGMPKGVTLTHGAMLQWAVATVEKYGFDEHTRFGNQAPVFYSNSIFDLYPTLYLGCTTYVIPSSCFVFPKKLIQFLRENEISALCMTPMNFVKVANTGVLEGQTLPSLHWVVMSGEAMPWGPLKQWMTVSPNATYYNFYGCTETLSCSLYPVDRDFAAGDVIPVGRPFEQVHVLLLNASGEPVARGETGELFVSSPWLSSGYYRDPERTEPVFVRDPARLGYIEHFYRTGDLARYTPQGELVIVGRKDAQIKHMGFRIELGEIEYAARAIPGWKNGCCLFDPDTDRLYLFWEGSLTESELLEGIKQRLQRYMIPDEWIHLEALPQSGNGKIDRMALKQQYIRRLT